MAKNRRFLGCQYPLEKTHHGILAQKSGVDQIKADLIQLLLTNPGERVMAPDFGTPLRKLVFEPNDLALEIQARQVILTAIQRWEPRIAIENVFISSQPDATDLNTSSNRDGVEHVLTVRITFFDPQDINEVQQLTLEVPIAGS